MPKLLTRISPLLRHLPAALLGAMVAIVLELVINKETFAEVRHGDVTGLIPEFFVGMLAGWLFDLCRDLEEASDKLAKLDTTFMSYLKSFFARDPYTLLTSETSHNGVIGKLLRRSVKSGYTAITEIDSNQYLDYLREAISASKSFDGIQRHSVRWFFSDDAARRGVTTTGPTTNLQIKSSYLSSLREKHMERKRRVFVIPDHELQMMEEDLANDELMARYWEETGIVETYWVSEAAFRKYYRLGPEPIIDDLALFDQQLLIKYDVGRNLLSFDLVGPDDPSRLVFQKLDEQLRVRNLAASLPCDAAIGLPR